MSGDIDIPAALEVGRSRISAIIPNYNHGAIIGAAVRALREQSHPPDEIVIIDDGSTDSSREIILGLANEHPGIKLILHDKNLGAIAAINTGIRAASYEFLFLAAADDITRPKLLERLLEAARETRQAHLVCAEMEVFESDGESLGLRPPVRPSHRVRRFSAPEVSVLLGRMDNFILTGASLISKSAMLEVGGLRSDLQSFADGFAVRQIALRHGFTYIPEVLAEWHVSPDGLSRSAALNPDVAEQLLDLAQMAFRSTPDFPTDYRKKFDRRWRFGVVRLAFQDAEKYKDVLERFAPRPRRLTRFFLWLARGGRFGRTLAMAWAYLFYRPTSLMGFLMTKLARSL